MKTRGFYYIDKLSGNDLAAADAQQGGDAGTATADTDQTLLGGADTGDTFQLPEKFIVKDQTGQVDFKASSGKLAQSYGELEKRMKDVGIPPKSAAEYQLEKYLPDGFEENPDNMKPLLEKFHAAGLSNKQVQAVLNAYGEQLGTVAGAEKQSMESGIAALKEAWGDQYEQNLTLARKALTVYGDQTERAAILADKRLANNPVFLRLLAKVGADLGEDKLPNDLNATGGEDIESLRRSEAYTNPRHPDHKAVVAKVNAAYKGGFKAK